MAIRDRRDYMRMFMRRKRAEAARVLNLLQPPTGRPINVSHVANAALAAKLEPLLRGLYVEGKKSVDTMSPGTVARLALKIEETLHEAGIVPSSRRLERMYKTRAKLVE